MAQHREVETLPLCCLLVQLLHVPEAIQLVETGSLCVLPLPTHGLKHDQVQISPT